MKQKNYIAGLYFRLSQEDERQGESVPIDYQRTILRKYAEEHGFTIHGEYIDEQVIIAFELFCIDCVEFLVF